MAADRAPVVSEEQGSDESRWPGRRVLILGGVALCAVVGLAAVVVRPWGARPAESPAGRRQPGTVPVEGALADRNPPAAAAPSLTVTERADESPNPEGFGVVLITSSPHGGIFKLDGRKVGVTCPLQVDHVDTSREHVLEAALSAGRPMVTQRFQVLPDETVVLHVRLDARGGGKVVGSGFSTVSGAMGALRVEATPACTVLVDGKRAGASPLKLRLPVGVHRVTLEGDAFGPPRSAEVRVNEGRVALVSVGR